MAYAILIVLAEVLNSSTLSVSMYIIQFPQYCENFQNPPNHIPNKEEWIWTRNDWEITAIPSLHYYDSFLFAFALWRKRRRRSRGGSYWAFVLYIEGFSWLVYILMLKVSILFKFAISCVSCSEMLVIVTCKRLSTGEIWWVMGFSDELQDKFVSFHHQSIFLS